MNMCARTILCVLIVTCFLLSSTQAMIEDLQTQVVEAVQLVARIKQSHQYFSNIFNCTEFRDSTLQRLFPDEKRFVQNKIMMERLFLQQFMFRDCSQIYEHGYQDSGIYPVWLQQVYRFTLFYCDMDTISEITNKRGWTVIQRRFNGEIDFERKWNDYEMGFGSLEGEHWIGLENIHALTWQNSSANKYTIKRTPPRLRIEFKDWDGIKGYAESDRLLVGAAESHYEIYSLGTFNGTAHPPGVAEPMQLYSFSTIDNDHTEQNCPRQYRGGWWFAPTCSLSNLNGPYPKRNATMGKHNIFWYNWYFVNETETALQLVSMKLQL